MRSVRSASLAAAVVLLVTVLAGCSAGAGAAKPSATAPTTASSASAAPSPVAPAPNRPTSRIALTCDSALPILAKLSPDPLSVTSDHVTDAEAGTVAEDGGWRLGPLSVLAAADQGVHCVYSTGAQDIVLDVVPDDDGSIAATFSGGNDCGDVPCEPVRFDHGVALQLQYDDGATSQDTQQQVLSDLMAAATIRADVPKATKTTDPAACSADLTPEAVRRIDGAVTTAKPRAVGDGGDRWSIDAALAFAAHVGGMCDYTDASGTTILSLSWLPDGAWAYDAYAAGDDLTADGVDAKFTCDAMACTLDVLGHGTWYRVTGSSTLDESTMRAYMNELAN